MHAVRQLRLWPLLHVLMVLPLTGCIAFSNLGERSTQLPEFYQGMPRTEIEQQLAPCGSEKREEDGSLVCIYNVRQVDHQPIVRSITMVADVLTLGAVSGLCGSQFVCDMTHDDYQRLYLTYDADDRLQSYHLND